MWKWLLGILLLIAVLLIGASAALGLSPVALWANVAVGTAMGAKLGCSGRYLTGLDESQVREDLASYSAALGAVSVSYDDAVGQARARLLGLAPTQADYRPGLGCTLKIGDTGALDTVQVPAVTRTTAPWPAGSGAPSRSAALTEALEAQLSRDNAAGEHTRALLVARGGTLVAEAYAPGFQVDTPHLGWSMGKSVVSILIGNLALHGKLALDETGLFPAWADDARSELRLDELLTMTSGLAFEEVYAPGSDATRMLFQARSAADVAQASPLAHEPGRHFSYSSGTSNLLARLIGQRLGGLQDSYDWVHEQILAPLAVTTLTLEPDPAGEWVGSSYVYASARDWARLGELMRQGGSLNGHRVLSESYVAHASAPNESDNDPRYGYQFWLNSGGDALRWPDLPADAYAMQGNRAQVVMIIPSAELVIVRLGWSPGRYPLNDNLAALVAAATGLTST
ncbi:MAG: serine hydrolase [Pseudomonadota bacterium]